MRMPLSRPIDTSSNYISGGIDLHAARLTHGHSIGINLSDRAQPLEQELADTTDSHIGMCYKSIEIL